MNNFNIFKINKNADCPQSGKIEEAQERRVFQAARDLESR